MNYQRMKYSGHMVICMNLWKETDYFGNIADYCQLYCQSIKNSCTYNSCDSDIYNKCDRP